MKLNSINDIFNAFSKLRILVLGDSMIDTYIIGKVERNSPEAPIPVLNKSSITKSLGGAANVALNLKNLGVSVILCSVIGSDKNGQTLKQLLIDDELSTDGIFEDSSRPTTDKSRYIASGKHLLRVDSESDHQIDSRLRKLFLDFVIKSLPDIDAIIFQDYDKGIFSEELISALVPKCNALNVPVIVDPKERNFFFYKNVALFKPNRREVEKAIGRSIDPSSEKNLSEAYGFLKHHLGFDSLLLTLSEYGILGVNDTYLQYLPAEKIEIKDVSGAGDTVVSVAAACVALKLPLEIIARLSNIAGGLVCEKSGAKAIERNEFLDAALIGIEGYLTPLEK
ncbi:MAG: bifunctional ADP-heptose synthase [Bacteroidetes bacterium]|nr:bifunctional ADP-heptose synthase [Bacteroidota bacterium]MDA1121527.1 bifunctional ADP-heptose synthase [Bacteroidota bacterium]